MTIVSTSGSSPLPFLLHFSLTSLPFVSSWILDYFPLVLGSNDLKITLELLTWFVVVSGCSLVARV